MDRIVTSLKTFQLSKDVRQTVSKINRRLAGQKNVSDLLQQLYREEMIGSEHYIFMETKLRLNRICASIERHFEDDVCLGIYLFDQQEKRLWVGADPNVPLHYREYANGLCVAADINGSDGVPEYGRRIVSIHDVESSEHFVSLNHRRDLLKSNIRAFCTTPLVIGDKVIGNANLYSPRPKQWSADDHSKLRRQVADIEHRLLEVKERFIQAASTL
ncbi:GAF domain-containing protein [Paenibacillus sp.]|uniref:GAF domain-containing protein n=1 Tax=Paenibacillus sp. TaxID=58172 RepID=UPI002D35881C|nr:GAF domain-containing protein [Paenibacillus sp.]HZG86110.1 GAF domain-containing protein [Paenibacillus sp.]